MTEPVEGFRERLRAAIVATGHGSFRRGLPRREALPLLGSLLGDVKVHLESHPDDAEVWRIRSEAEEASLRWVSALDSLERALTVAGERDRRDLKRLARLREQAAIAAAHGLDPFQLRELARALEDVECDHAGAPAAQAWLEAAGVATPARTIVALGATEYHRPGEAVCDCAVSSGLRRLLQT